MVSNFPLFELFMVALLVMNLLFLFSPQPWKEEHRHQCQVVYLVYLAGFTAFAVATGDSMFLSIGMAALTLFMAVSVVGGYVKRSRASGRAS
jgi:hypothetical protein